MERAVGRGSGRNGHNRRGHRVRHAAAAVAPHHSAAASVRSDDGARRIGRPHRAPHLRIDNSSPVSSRADWVEHVGLVRRRDGSLLLLFGRPAHTAVGRGGRLETGGYGRFSSSVGGGGMLPQEFTFGQQLFQLFVDVLLRQRTRRLRLLLLLLLLDVLLDVGVTTGGTITARKMLMVVVVSRGGLDVLFRLDGRNSRRVVIMALLLLLLLELLLLELLQLNELLLLEMLHLLLLDRILLLVILLRAALRVNLLDLLLVPARSDPVGRGGGTGGEKGFMELDRLLRAVVTGRFRHGIAVQSRRLFDVTVLQRRRRRHASASSNPTGPSE